MKETMETQTTPTHEFLARLLKRKDHLEMEFKFWQNQFVEHPDNSSNYEREQRNASLGMINRLIEQVKGVNGNGCVRCQN